MKFLVRLIFPCAILLVFTQAFGQGGRFNDRNQNVNETASIPPAPRYADLQNWASHPLKRDNGDSIPQPLRKQFVHDSTIDVFFIHPTTYMRKENDQMNGDVNSETINRRTDNRTILNQASAFNEYRLFAPRYRQANYSAYMSLLGGYREVFDTAYSDIKKAFQYYLQHWNVGRPFFIASHSQGTQHAVRLIRELIEGTPLEKKLISAYIIGTPPVKTGTPGIPVCKDPAQTGCYIAWNTFTEEFRQQFDFLGRADLETVNPLTWSTNDNKATNTLHQGAVMDDFNTVRSKALSAQIKSGKLVVWPESDEMELPGSLQTLHVLDINLFYVDIRNNLRTRVAAYRKNHSSL